MISDKELFIVKDTGAVSAMPDGEKSLETLLAEFEQRNSTYLSKEDLRAKYLATIAVTNKDSAVTPRAKNISEWTAEDCKTWATQLKATRANNPTFYPEMLAVITRANELSSGYQLRAAQLLALLLLLESKKKGRLAEIATGEGKTTIVAMLAVIKALQGKKPDIITSSPILASAAVKEKKAFYELFNLTIACNGDNGSATQLEPGFKHCYAADVVYGDAHSFQWDLLRHEYEEENTRGDRPYNLAIVDEVDSLLIDDAANSAQLAGHRPAFEFLEPLLVACWQELTRINQGFSTVDGQLFWQAEPTSQRHEIPDRQKFLESSLIDYLNTLITKTDSPLFIPQHLKTFALAQTKIWVQSAILSLYNYSEDKHYTITANDAGHNVIAPIDYANTGVIHANSTWPDGLQQFLQIKHSLKISAESLIACYISNMSYFKRYGKQIYGLSGTLGAKDEQTLLADTYGIDFVFVPTYKPKDFKEKPGIIANDATSWIETITTSTIAETTAKRGVLIICESMDAVAQIQKKLQANGVTKIRCYAKNDESLAVERAIEPGEVIIATNLAGRGTDIKTTSEVQANGGLHVCVTFLPRNQRIEDQAFGRTSRQGNSGTGQLIVNQTEAFVLLKAYGVSTDDILDMAKLKKQRNLMESIRLQNVREIEAQKIVLKDELFAKFCALSQQLGSKKKTKDRYKLKQIEELWSLWLHDVIKDMNCKLAINREQIMLSFAEFEANARIIFKTDNIHNPCYLVCSGNDLSHAKQYKHAIAEYGKAVDLDPELAVHAYYNRARAIIESLEPDYKQKAIADLEKAKSIIIETLLPQIRAVPVIANFVPGTDPNATTDLSCQTDVKVELFKRQLEHIGKAITVLRNSSRDVVVKGYKSISSTFSDSFHHDNEIVELNAAGLESFFEVAQIPPKKKRRSFFGAICCAFLGLCQIVAGAFCYATGNVFLGQVLIKEGVGDIMYAIRGAINGDFSWRKYKEYKIVSIAITVATTGIDSIRAKAAAARDTTKAVAKSAAEAGAKETGKNSALDQIRQENLLRAAKQQIAKSVISSGVSTVANFAFERVSKIAVNSFKDEIKEHIRKCVLEDLNRADFKDAIDRLLATDVCNKNHEQLNKIRKAAFDIISPKQDRFNTIVRTIHEGIAAHVHPAAAVAVKLSHIHGALSKISNLINDFSDDFIMQVKTLASSLPEPKTKLNHTSEQARNDLHYQTVYQEIINTISKCVMAHLSGGVAQPIIGQIMERSVQNITQKLYEWQQERVLASTGPIVHPGITAGYAAGDAIDEKNIEKAKKKDKEQKPKLTEEETTREPKVLTKKPEQTTVSDTILVLGFLGESPIQFFYRGTSKRLTYLTVFSDGFRAPGMDMDVARHAFGNPKSGYIPTTPSLGVAKEFARDKGGYVYKINPQPNAVDVNAALGSKYCYRYQCEMAIPDIIHGREVAGVYDLTKCRFIPNPNCVLPRGFMLWQTARNVGRGFTIVGLIVDGISFGQAWQDSRRSCDNSPVIHEATRIVGGWSGAVAGGASGAKLGIKLCRPFGPYGSPVCGVIGGVVGSISGYWGGSELLLQLKDRAQKLLQSFTVKTQQPESTMASDSASATAHNTTERVKTATSTLQSVVQPIVRNYKIHQETKTTTIDPDTILVPTTTARSSFLRKILSFFIPSVEAATIYLKPSLPLNYCERPYYEDTKKAHDRVKGYFLSVKEAGDLIGGYVKRNIDEGHFKNACTLRAIFALFNAPEVQDQVKCKIPVLISFNGKVPRRETVSGGDGLQYIFRNETLIMFLTKIWGPPDYDGRKRDTYVHHLETLEYGVAITLMPGHDDFTAHVEITKDACLTCKNVIFWRLPSRIREAVLQAKSEILEERRAIAP